MSLDFDSLFPTSPLHDAVAENDLEAVRKLLADGADINSHEGFGGDTPLHQALRSAPKARQAIKDFAEGLSKQIEKPTETENPLANLPNLKFSNLAREFWQRPQEVSPPTPENLEMVRFLLEQGADVNATDNYGYTPLMMAARAGQLETVRLLLDWGADTHPQNDKNVLMQAAEFQRADVVRLLLERGADAEQRTPNGATLLMAAARGGSVEILRLLVERGAALDVTMDTGGTALLAALLAGQEEASEYLRSAGAKVGVLELMAMGELEQADALPLPADRTPHWGFGVLDWAIRHEKRDVIGFLLEKGIRFDPNDERGKKLMQRAMFLGDQETIGLLREAGLYPNLTFPSRRPSRNDTPPLSNLSMAITLGNVEMARMLIEEGANPDGDESDIGISPLVSAIVAGNRDMITMLLDMGANVNGTHRDTMSPLTMATIQNKEEIVKLLLERGANPKDQSTHVGASALSMAQNSPLLPLLKDAIKSDWFELAKAGKTDELLTQIDAGGDLNATDEYDRTALHLAARNGHLETVRALLDRGMDINLPGLMEISPLMEAVGGGNLDVVRLLLERGADVNQTAQRDGKALIMALHGKKKEIADCLVQAGAKVGLVEAAFMGDLEMVHDFLRSGSTLDETSNDMTALMAAANGGHRNLVEFLLEQGADINAASRMGFTALLHAVTGSHLDMVALLLDRGADPNACHRDGWRGEWTSKHNRELRDRNTDPRAQEYREQIWARMRAPVPLEMAAFVKGDDAIARLLLDRGADPNGTDELFDASPLLSAVGADRTDLVRLLLERGADPKRHHPESQSLLHYAKMMNKSPEIIKIIHDAVQYSGE